MLPPGFVCIAITCLLGIACLPSFAASYILHPDGRGDSPTFQNALDAPGAICLTLNARVTMEESTITYNSAAGSDATFSIRADCGVRMAVSSPPHLLANTSSL